MEVAFRQLPSRKLRDFLGYRYVAPGEAEYQALPLRILAYV